MKKVGQWIRRLIEGALDLLGRMRLMTIVLVIIVASGVLFGTSLYDSNRIAKELIHTEYQEYNETIFRQTETALNHSFEDLTQLLYTFMSNRFFVDYINEETFYGRMSRMDEIKQEFDSIFAIQDDIKAFFLYDLNGKLVSSAGRMKFLDTGCVETDGIVFTGLLESDSMQYFGIHMPVIDVNSQKIGKKVGYCQVLVSMNYVERSIGEFRPGGDSFVQLTDAQGGEILHRGEVPALLENLESEDELVVTPEGYMLYQSSIARTNWRMCFGVSQAQLYANVSLLQENYNRTYIALGILLLLLLAMLYASVLRPIHMQILFMNYYAKNRTSRMKVRSKNEMGELARNLNQMLDDIDRLTAEKVKAQEQALEADYRKKQSELFAYRNQVNPHFLRNTFECIRGMALYYNVEDIAAITESLSALFSYNLLGKGYAQVKDIREHIDNYCSIIRYRFNNRYTIRVEIDEAAQEVLFPKMVVQPLAENAIFHGLETVETGGMVDVRIRRSGQQLIVQVKDNGSGIPEDALRQLRENLVEYDRTNDFPARKHGIGVINVYRRLRLFYGDLLEFSIESTVGQGTEITICVPCVTQVMEGQNVPGFFDR